MNYNFKNLVFEGGGVKGIAYGGALEELEKRNILSNISRVAGTSAGAINACLLALGYSHKEVSDIIAQTNFKNFEDGSIIPFFNINRVVQNYGWFKGDSFSQWIGKLIKEKTGSTDCTFKQLTKASADKAFRHLYVVSTNLSKQRSDVLSHETTPDMPLHLAVRMSMSIPLFFQSIELKNDIVVDGGVAWNYAVNMFDHRRYVDNLQNATPVDYDTDIDYLFNHETLGFRLGSTKEIKFSKDDWASEPVEINGLKGYITALVNFMLEMANKKHLHKNDWGRTVFIDTLDVRTTDFDLSKQKINALINSGREGTINFFNWRNADEKLSTLPAKAAVSV
ncbi:MAG: patatin-like phospholipase family protein [Bacteroidia bacterium]|nr:patatin-like phospholipase family protein [Bacteroidia bacterium]